MVIWECLEQFHKPWVQDVRLLNSFPWHTIIDFGGLHLHLFPVVENTPNLYNLQYGTRPWWGFLGYAQSHLEAVSSSALGTYSVCPTQPWDITVASKDMVLSKETSVFGVQCVSRFSPVVEPYVSPGSLGEPTSSWSWATPLLQTLEHFPFQTI